MTAFPEPVSACLRRAALGQCTFEPTLTGHSDHFSFRADTVINNANHNPTPTLPPNLHRLFPIAIAIAENATPYPDFQLGHFALADIFLPSPLSSRPPPSQSEQLSSQTTHRPRTFQPRTPVCAPLPVISLISPIRNREITALCCQASTSSSTKCHIDLSRVLYDAGSIIPIETA